MAGYATLRSILAVVDDLMVVSRIRTSATAHGARLTVAASIESALARVRADRPGLVILDLDNPRIDALELLRRFQADPDLASIHTLGLVSHVNGERIVAARAAGIVEAVARSAFAKRLEALMSPPARP